MINLSNIKNSILLHAIKPSWLGKKLALASNTFGKAMNHAAAQKLLGRPYLLGLSRETMYHAQGDKAGLIAPSQRPLRSLLAEIDLSMKDVGRFSSQTELAQFGRLIIGLYHKKYEYVTQEDKKIVLKALIKAGRSIEEIKVMADYVFADRGGLNQSFMTHACALVVAKSETTAAYDQWGETLKRRRCGDDILLKCLSLASNADEFKALEQKFSAIKAAFEGKKISVNNSDYALGKLKSALLNKGKNTQDFLRWATAFIELINKIPTPTCWQYNAKLLEGLAELGEKAESEILLTLTDYIESAVRPHLPGLDWALPDEEIINYDEQAQRFQGKTWRFFGGTDEGFQVKFLDELPNEACVSIVSDPFEGFVSSFAEINRYELTITLPWYYQQRHQLHLSERGLCFTDQERPSASIEKKVVIILCLDSASAREAYNYARDLHEGLVYAIRTENRTMLKKLIDQALAD